MASTLSIYDGRDLVGIIREADGTCEAFTAAGARLGVFKSRKAAIAAVNNSLVSSCVGDTNARRDGSG